MLLMLCMAPSMMMLMICISLVIKDVENAKLGEAIFENRFARNGTLENNFSIDMENYNLGSEDFENMFASESEDDLFENIIGVKDDYPLDCDNDTMNAYKLFRPPDPSIHTRIPQLTPIRPGERPCH